MPAALEAITLTDVNAPNGKLTVTIGDATGLFAAAVRGAGTVTGGGSRQLILTGNLADIDAELASLTDTEFFVGSDTVQITATDAVGARATSSIAVTTSMAPRRNAGP